MEIFDIIGILLTPIYKYKTFKYYFKVTYGNYFVDWLTSLKEETIFLNIGANQGQYSFLVGKNPLVKKIFSFEPNDNIVPLFLNNFKVNHIETAEVISSSISNVSGTLSLNTVEGHSGKSSFRLENNASTANLTVKTIQTMHHLELINHIPQDSINGIKINVEGHEEVVIKELVKCIFLVYPMDLL